MSKPKLYIAGIVLKNLAQITHLDTNQRIESIIKLIPKIKEDATEQCGEDCLILIAIREYGLCKQAISKIEKDGYLKRLQEVIASYTNIIFIPGSIPYYKPIDTQIEDGKVAIQKIEAKYKFLEPHLSMDDVFKVALDDKQKLFQNLPREIYSLKNSSYLFFKNEKLSHAKSSPHTEKSILLDVSNEIIQNSIFVPGIDEVVKTLSYQDQKLKMAIQICYEHSANSYQNAIIKNTQPNIHVVIGEFVDLSAEDLAAEVTILLDRRFRMKVVIDSEQHKNSPFSAIIACKYIRKNGDSIEFKDKKACKIFELEDYVVMEELFVDGIFDIHSARNRIQLHNLLGKPAYLKIKRVKWLLDQQLVTLDTLINSTIIYRNAIAHGEFEVLDWLLNEKHLTLDALQTRINNCGGLIDCENVTSIEWLINRGCLTPRNLSIKKDSNGLNTLPHAAATGNMTVELGKQIFEANEVIQEENDERSFVPTL